MVWPSGTMHTNDTMSASHWYTVCCTRCIVSIHRTLYSTVVMVLAGYSTYWASASEWWGQRNHQTVTGTGPISALLRLSLHTRWRDREWLTPVVLGATPSTLVVSKLNLSRVATLIKKFLPEGLNMAKKTESDYTIPTLTHTLILMYALSISNPLVWSSRQEQKR